MQVRGYRYLLQLLTAPIGEREGISYGFHP